MKSVLFIWIISFFCCNAIAQKQYLNIVSLSDVEQKKIDSLGYAHLHTDARSVVQEVNSFSDKLLRSGYIEAEVENNSKLNDSTFVYQFKLGKRTASIHIYVDKNSAFKDLLVKEARGDTLTIPFPEIEEFMKRSLNQLERKGFALAKIKLIQFEKKKEQLYAELTVQSEQQRRLDDIVIKGPAKFPESHRKQLLKIYKKRVFNQDNLKNIYSDIEKFRFVKQTRFPEILFKTDSTKVYCYLEKSKSNTFDGFIGFSNAKSQKVLVNGYVDLVLNNLLNTGEKFALNWKSNGNDQKTFNAAIELPYIFDSPLAVKAHLSIFKQDSTFQNTVTALDLGYLLNYNTRLYLGYQSSESSDIQNQNSINISDYSNSFVTSQFQYVAYRPEEFLFPEKTKIDLKTGAGSRRSKLTKNDQIFLDLSFQHTFFLNEKNNIQLKSQNYYLNSDRYIVNELYRFGGINSIRGFNENSLQAHLVTSLLSEYRYIIAPNLYVHSITDYGYYDDETTANRGALLGLGLGFGLATKNGLFNLVYANGSSKGQEIKGSNSIVHVSFKTQF